MKIANRVRLNKAKKGIKNTCKNRNKASTLQNKNIKNN